MDFTVMQTIENSPFIDMGSAHPLLVSITQEIVSCTQYVSDGDLRKQPVRWHGRIQLCKPVRTNPFNQKW